MKKVYGSIKNQNEITLNITNGKILYHYMKIDDWKKSVSTAITENLIKKSLKKIGTDAEKLAKITIYKF